MPVSMPDLADDLAAESAVLRALLVPLDEDGWRRPTPAAGWSVLDQVTHLAHFDATAVQSALDPDGFRATLEPPDPDAVAAAHRGRTGADVLAWFDDARARLLAAFRGLDPALRVPWYGPPMSAASALTARIMETWAHGQDIADALGASREPTARLRHVAHIGIGARTYSYVVNGKEPPATPIRVELAAPDGGTWAWGPADAADRVTGPALDFCLAVTQRRHLDDVALEVTGPVAAEWMGFAQAYAGPAGTGRARKAGWEQRYSRTSPATSSAAVPSATASATVAPQAGKAAIAAPAAPSGPFVRAPLGRVAGARSGDKGGDANVGFWARDDAGYAWLGVLPHRRTGAGAARDGGRRAGRRGPPAAQSPRGQRRRPRPARRRRRVVDAAGPAGEGLGEYLRSRVVDVPSSLL